MGLSVGIVGLPNVGKSTLFNALLKKQLAYVANFPFATVEPNIGIVPVPDNRLKQLSQAVKESEGLNFLPPEVPATVRFVDIAGLIAGASKGEGLGNKFLAQIREVDAICHVLRVFSDPDIIKQGVVDPKSDFETVKTELDLADLETVEAHRKKSSKGGSASGGKNANVESLPLFSKKPILVVLNVDEESLKVVEKIEQEGAESLGVNRDQVVAISAKVEAELSELSDADAKAYLQDLGVEKSGLERLIKKAFATLGLITFLTAGPKEVRAWTIKEGTDAQKAAGAIHSDFEKNFIKADVCDFKDFINLGWKKAREEGKIRSEGRDYLVKDGDVVEFKVGV